MAQNKRNKKKPGVNQNQIQAELAGLRIDRNTQEYVLGVALKTENHLFQPVGTTLNITGEMAADYGQLSTKADETIEAEIRIDAQKYMGTNYSLKFSGKINGRSRSAILTVKLPNFEVSYFKAEAKIVGDGYQVVFKGMLTSPLGGPVANEALSILDEELKQINTTPVTTDQNGRFIFTADFGQELAGQEKEFSFAMAAYPISQKQKVKFPKPEEPKPGKIELNLYYNKRIRPDIVQKDKWLIKYSAELLEDGVPITGQTIRFIDGLQNCFAKRKITKRSKKAQAVHLIPLRKAGKPIEVVAEVEYKGQIFRSRTLNYNLPEWPDYLKIKDESRFGKELIPQAFDHVIKQPRTWLHLLPMFLVPLTTIVILSRLEEVGSSILFGTLVALAVAWTSKARLLFPHGLIWGGILGFANFVFPQLFTETMIMASIIFLLLGPVTWITEEITDPSIRPYPWWILYLCLALAGFSFVGTLIAGTWGVELYKNYFYSSLIGFLEPQGQVNLAHYLAIRILEPLADNNAFIRGGAEITRWTLIGHGMLWVYKFLMSGVLCFTISAPGEIKKWWDRINIGNLKEIFTTLLGLIGFRQVSKKEIKR